MDQQQISEFIHQAFPNNEFIIENATSHYSLLRLPINSDHLRPGNSVSGPTIMALADCAFYVAVLASVEHSEAALTTQLSFNFLARPEANQDLIAECQLLKISKRQAFGEINLYSCQTSKRLVAHAVGNYSLPHQAHT